jgi:hypothetical protein
MMAGMITLILMGLLRGVRTQRSLVFENLALRHQLVVLQRTAPRPRLRPSDRVFWILLARLWHGWAEAVAIVQPATVIRWQRSGFKLVWARKSRRNGPGRPAVAPEVRALIRRLSMANPLLYSIRPESEVRRGDPSLPRKQRAEGREATTHDGQGLADQRTEPSRAPGGSAQTVPVGKRTALKVQEKVGPRRAGIRATCRSCSAATHAKSEGGEPVRYYLGVDWADQTHAVWVMDERGTKITARTVPHTAEGLSEWGRELDEWRAQGIERWAAIERPKGRVVT